MKKLIVLIITFAVVSVGALFMSGGTTQAQQCDQAYPGICVPPPPPDLNCDDIPYYRDFAVNQPDDPHGFDRNEDGEGCESSSFGTAAPRPVEPTPAPPTVEPIDSAPTDLPVAQPTAIAVVAASGSPPVAPNAGFGPGELPATSPMVWLVFGLIGAGVAWLSVGLSGAVIQAFASQEPLLKPRDADRRSRK